MSKADHAKLAQYLIGWYRPTDRARLRIDRTLFTAPFEELHAKLVMIDTKLELKLDAPLNEDVFPVVAVADRFNLRPFIRHDEDEQVLVLADHYDKLLAPVSVTVALPSVPTFVGHLQSTRARLGEVKTYYCVQAPHYSSATEWLHLKQIFPPQVLVDAWEASQIIDQGSNFLGDPKYL